MPRIRRYLWMATLICTTTLCSTSVIALRCPKGSKVKRFKRMRACVRGRLKHGPFVERLARGGGLRAGRYVRGRLHGVVTEHDSAGKLRARTPYDRGRLHGTAVRFKKHGELKSKVTWARGVKHGPAAYHWRYSSDHGNYHTGHRHGAWQIRLSTGERTELIYHKGVVHGAERSYAANGTLVREGVLNKGARGGVWRQWWPSGTKSAEGVYRGAVRHGLWRWWHPNGQPSRACEYRHGKLHGLCKTWSDAGRLMSQGRWIHGLRQGVHKLWYANGAQRESGRWRDNRLHGTRLELYADGTLQQRSTWVDGRPDGLWIRRAPAAQIAKIAVFRQGQLRRGWLETKEQVCLAANVTPTQKSDDPPTRCGEGGPFKAL